MGSQCVGADPSGSPARDPDPREILAALADGASALRLLAREFAFDNRRFIALGSRDEAATRAHKHYERLYQHAVMLAELANELALAPVTPDEDHT